MDRDEVITRRLIAVILGLLGLMVLVDVAVIAVVHPSENYEGFRHVMLLIIGGLLVCGGAITFAWPKRQGSIKTPDDDDQS